MSSISAISLFSNTKCPWLKGPNVEAETCRAAILEERFADGRIETERRRADCEGLGSGVDAEKQVDWDKGGRI